MNDMNYVWSVYDLDMNWMPRNQEFGLQLDTRKHCLLFILLIRLWQVVWRNEACAYCRFAPCQDQQNQHVMLAAAGFSTTQNQSACEVSYQITTQSGRTTCWEWTFHHASLLSDQACPICKSAFPRCFAPQLRRGGGFFHILQYASDICNVTSTLLLHASQCMTWEWRLLMEGNPVLPKANMPVGWGWNRSTLYLHT